METSMFQEQSPDKGAKPLKVKTKNIIGTSKNTIDIEMALVLLEKPRFLVMIEKGSTKQKLLHKFYERISFLDVLNISKAANKTMNSLKRLKKKKEMQLGVKIDRKPQPRKTRFLNN